MKTTLIKTAAAVAASTLTATLMVGEHPATEVAEPVARQAGAVRTETASANTSQGDDLDLARLSRRQATPSDDLFSPLRPPAPPPPPPAALLPTVEEPPPKPVAPPLPFKYIGRMVDAGVTTVFLSRGGQNVSIHAGDVVENLYRIESISDTGITLTYLPLQEQQVLNIGSKN